MRQAIALTCVDFQTLLLLIRHKSSLLSYKNLALNPSGPDNYTVVGGIVTVSGGLMHARSDCGIMYIEIQLLLLDSVRYA